MAIEVRWDHINRYPVLVYEFYRGWTWKDFFDVKLRADTLLESSSVKIPLLFDLRRTPDMPPGMLKHTRKYAVNRQMNGSPIIVIGASKVVQTTFTIVARMIAGYAEHELTDDILFVAYWEDVPDSLRRHGVS